MAGFLLHDGATVLCAHAGQAQPATTDPRVKVNGQPVATQAAPYTVTACPFAPGSAPSPCVTAQWMAAATRLRAGGVPVLLHNSQAICVPNGTGLNVVFTQQRVKGM